MTKIEISETDLLETLRQLGGFYECPKDSKGRRLGPLVGYAGRYDGLQFVGDVYANFAKLERIPSKFRPFAVQLAEQCKVWFPTVDAFCGAPEGGKALAELLALELDKGYLFPEKEVTAVKTPSSRELSRLFWGRHEIQFREQVVIVEDVMNNFSTTQDLIHLIKESCGVVLGVVGLFNRSLTVGEEFAIRSNERFPVHALVRKPIQQYRQDDPEVAADIAAGNVVWKPKNREEWARLMTAMNGHKK